MRIVDVGGSVRRVCVMECCFEGILAVFRV